MKTSFTLRSFFLTGIAAVILVLTACSSGSSNNTTDNNAVATTADTPSHSTDTSANNDMVTAADPADDPYANLALDVEASPLNLPEVKNIIGYPAIAKEAEIEGKVVVRVQVSNTGTYIKHVVLKDPHPVLTKEVSNKLFQLKFKPAMKGGQPVKSWITIPFDFKLQK